MEYYELAGNRSEIIECYYHLEDYKKLESFIQILPEGDPLLEKIGNMFAATAVNNEAVQAYCKVKYKDFYRMLNFFLCFSCIFKILDTKTR